MQILIINLTQSKDRLHQQQVQFKALGLDFTRLPAVSINDIDEQEYQSLAFDGQRPLKQSELACFLSHKKAWQWVLECQQPTLILEDDAVLVKNLGSVLDKIEQLKNIDFVNLEVHGRKKTIAKESALAINTYHLYQLFIDRSGAGGYVLFPSGAKVLLNYLHQRAIGLADEFIYDCQALRKYQIEPACILQSDKCEQYGVIPTIIHHSTIAHIKNNTDIQISLLQKIKFKLNRIKTQVKLGLLQLKYLKNGSKRHIAVDKDRF